MKIKIFCILLIFINIEFPVICQKTGSGNAQVSERKVTNVFIPSAYSKVGDALPSTGMDQFPPQISNVCMVALDILCIEIDACRIIPSIQIPYRPEPADVITEQFTTPLGETRNVYVSRNGFQLGSLVGTDRNILTLHERIAGKHLNVDEADKIGNYLISSPGDNNYFLPLSPVKVWRKSKPSGWTDTSWLMEKSQVSTEKHFIYLKLQFPLKPGNAYLINLPGLNLNHSAFYYVHDPVYVRSEAVHVSQIGFRPDDPEKNAFLSVWMGTGEGYTYPEGLEFSLIDDITNERVYRGKGVIQWKASDYEGIGTKANHIGTDLIRLDFSSFCTPGRYRVCVEGIGCGYPFYINETNTWRRAFEISMKGHFNHRSGICLMPPYTDFVRPRTFNPVDGIKVYQSTCSLLNSGNGLNALNNDKGNFGNLVAGKTEVLVPEAWGGTMDAGDWDRRIQHLAAPRLYLELFELNPDYFKNVCLYIPESSDSIPDIVDEALFGLDMYRRMQMPEGGIRGGVESSEHPSEGTASWQERLTILAYAPDHWSSYIYSGVAARAALILKMLGENDKALIWETSAVKAMKWAEVEYEKWTKSPDFIKIIDDGTKRNVLSERNLASVELYRLTGDKLWHRIFILTQDFISDEAAFVYARLDNAPVKNKLRQTIIDRIINKANSLVELSSKNAFGITTGSPGNPMGPSSYSTPASTILVRAHYLSGDTKYLKTILRSTLFTAGANPMNLCLTTGLGENYVRNPLHEDSRHTGQIPPIGITVFGPCELEYSDARSGSALAERLNRSCTPLIQKWPPSESYFDVFWFVAQNEYVIWTPLGPTAYVWGYLASRK